MLRKILAVFFTFIIFTVTCFGEISNCQAEAASKAGKVKAAYTELLSGLPDNDTQFAVIDINEDGIPEMVYSEDNFYHTSFVAYVNNEIKILDEGFSGEQKYYPGKCLYYSYTGGHSFTFYKYYKFTGKKLKSVAEKKCEDMLANPPVFEYRINGKKVTQRKYKNYTSKLLVGAKEVKLKPHKNTALNRKRYL